MNSSTLGITLAPGLDVSGVLYRYTTVKDPADPFKVHVQNESAAGSGFIFRSTDDWTGVPGNTLSKYVPVELSPISSWGRGSIETEGTGQVVNPSVVYTFRLDECFNAEITPGCPGYIDPSRYNVQPADYQIYNALDDDWVRRSMSATDSSLYNKEKKDADLEDAEERATKDDFEKGLSAAKNALTLANKVSQEAVISAMNASVNMYTYYSLSISGGVYPDSGKLVDSKLPENRLGLRNGLAQQLLHQKMVDQQYQKLRF